VPRRRDEEEDDDLLAMFFGAAPFFTAELGKGDAAFDPDAEDRAEGDDGSGDDPYGEGDD
jgi:hypothetical protein